MKILKSTLVFVICMSFNSLSAIARETQDVHTRPTYPSAISVEALGRATQWSLNFDQVIDEDLSVGLGFGHAPARNGSSTNIVPVYANYYFKQHKGSLFATGGVSIIAQSSQVKGSKSTSGDVTFSDSVMLPVLGAGFESRGDQGFLFRATGYVFVAKPVAPWLGFSFGYAF